MKEFKATVLGEEWTISLRSESEDSQLKMSDGYTDITCKTIVVGLQKEECDLKRPTVYLRKVLRHELVHAFMFECGLAENWTHAAMGQEEMVVDWIAIQLPRLHDVCSKAEAEMILLLTSDDTIMKSPTLSIFCAYNDPHMYPQEGDKK